MLCAALLRGAERRTYSPVLFGGNMGVTVAMGDTVIPHCHWLPLAAIP
jgi:hypothetical protein